MKPFRKLTRHLDQWYHDRLESASSNRLGSTVRQFLNQSRPSHAQSTPLELRDSQLEGTRPPTLTIMASRLKHRRRTVHVARLPNSVILVSAVLSLTSAIGYRFYNEPQLAVDSFAPQTLRAPDDAVVEDVKTTEINRDTARTGAVPVLMVDQSVNQRIYQSFQQVLEQADELRIQAGGFPFVETSVLSTPTQRYLRRVQEWEWRSTIITAEADRNRNDSVQSSQFSANSGEPLPETADQVNSGLVTASHELAVFELQNYRRSHSAEDWLALKNLLEQSRVRYAKAKDGLALVLRTESQNPRVFDTTLLNITDSEWSDTKVLIRQALERILAQGIPQGLPSSLIENAVRMQVVDAPLGTESMAISILTSVIKPNLIKDPEQTRMRAEMAAEAVEPEVVRVREGEVIVQAREKITQSDFVLLDHFNMSRRRINTVALIGLAGLISGAIVIFLVTERLFHPGLRTRDRVLMVLLVLSVPLVAALGVPTTSLPAIGLLVGSFYGSVLGLTVLGLLGVIVPVGLNIGWTVLVSNLAGSLVAALMAGRLRSREELAFLGLGIGLTQGVVYLILNLIISTSAGPIWFAIVTAASIQGLLGIAWSVVALGISPYLENLFDLVTPTRLVELSNPNRPLLKRLASEAPGTFQHTLFVATLAEAAARSLGGCNVELVRAGTLYHDIGKMHDSLGFIENQMGGPNKHDAIDDPWKSARIIKKHVSEGLVMARKCRLPRALQAFIPEHQGTMLITYFYYQAMQRAKENPELQVDEADFRYSGPIPQSRETGIVMLADSCEAALRSLKEATPEEALAMVNRILRARWQDNQLVDSGLTREEMTQIAELFVQVWLQFNHQRIPYPKAALNPPTQASTV